MPDFALPEYEARQYRRELLEFIAEVEQWKETERETTEAERIIQPANDEVDEMRMLCDETRDRMAEISEGFLADTRRVRAYRELDMYTLRNLSEKKGLLSLDQPELQRKPRRDMVKEFKETQTTCVDLFAMITSWSQKFMAAQQKRLT